MSVQALRIEALLDAIDNYRALPETQREQLRPLLNETLDRFNDISGYSETIRGFLWDLGQDVESPPAP